MFLSHGFYYHPQDQGDTNAAPAHQESADHNSRAHVLRKMSVLLYLWNIQNGFFLETPALQANG